MRLDDLRRMRKDYAARRRYAAMDSITDRRGVKAYRAWRRRWLEAIERHVRMKQR